MYECKCTKLHVYNFFQKYFTMFGLKSHSQVKLLQSMYIIMLHYKSVTRDQLSNPFFLHTFGTQLCSFLVHFVQKKCVFKLKSKLCSMTYLGPFFWNNIKKIIFHISLNYNLIITSN